MSLSPLKPNGIKKDQPHLGAKFLSVVNHRLLTMSLDEYSFSAVYYSIL